MPYASLLTPLPRDAFHAWVHDEKYDNHTTQCRTLARGAPIFVPIALRYFTTSIKPHKIASCSSQKAILCIDVVRGCVLPMRTVAFVLLSRRFPSAQMSYRLVVFQNVFDLRSQFRMNERQSLGQIFVHRTFGYTKLFGNRPYGMSCVYDALTDDERALPYRFVHPHRLHRMDGAVYGHTTNTMRKNSKVLIRISIHRFDQGTSPFARLQKATLYIDVLHSG
jgi:hypothetical protein